MAEKMLCATSKAELIKIAEGHEESAKSLEGAMVGGSQRLAGIA